MKKFVLSFKHTLCLAIIIFGLIAIAGCGAKESASQNTADSTASKSVLTDKPAVVENSTSDASAAAVGNSVNKASTGAATGVAEKIAVRNTAAPATKSGKLLSIEGSGVEGVSKISLADLKGMKQGLFAGDFFALNSYGTKAYFSFKGAALAYILDHAVTLKKSASKVTFLADDGYSFTCTLAEARKTDYIDEQNPDQHYPVVIAWEENGKAYDPAEGSPFRVVFGQKAAGDVNKPNWVLHVKTIRID